MTLPDLALERLLTEAHAASGPTPSERLRALERLELTISAPPVTSLQEASTRDPSSQDLRLRTLQHGSHVPGEAPSVQQGSSGAALSVAQWGALLGIALAAGAVLYWERVRELPAVREVAAPSSSARGASAEAQAEIPAARTLGSPTPTPTSTPPGPGSVSRTRLHRAATQSLEPKPAVPSVPDLREALRLLREAQRALREQQGGKALSLLDELARRAPDALVEEREVTRVLGWCATGDDAAARRAASSVRQSWPASPYAHRLSQSCVGSEPSSGSEELQPRTPE
jgi:hypothetical protein